MDLNAIVQTPIMLKALATQNRQLFRNCKKVHKIVLKDLKVKLREIVDTLKISKVSVFTILHKSLNGRWNPCNTVEGDYIDEESPK